jgi:two-component system, OmpR family, copper resistance phosphate regulon response regulator CusR
MPLLIVEPDVPLATFLHNSLESAGHQVLIAHRLADAQRFLLGNTPEVMLLDLDMPSESASSLLQQVRTTRPEVRVLAITASLKVEQRIEALDEGADDCVVKPFRFAELAARIRALMRRPTGGTNLLLRAADLELDRTGRKVHRGTHPVELTTKEFALLEYLMLNAGRAVTRADIIRDVWNMTFQNNTNVVDVYINYLRKKIDEESAVKLIHTVRGTGYKLSVPCPTLNAAIANVPTSQLAVKATVAC